ncbi:MAG: hypothetical protein LBI39_04000 [Puniceicoccales bacterium]|jgi:hypothetical protein|nr:hypothetical protein [Puniceicoccales bacterium]
MGAWVKLLAGDLETHVAADQLRAIVEASLGADGAEHMEKLRQSIVAQVRAAVMGGGRAVLSATDDAVPEELWSDACALLMEKLQCRLPALRLTVDQVRAADVARQRLRRVERGEVVPSMPADPSFRYVRPKVHFRCRRRIAIGDLGGL